ncbi:MAG: hypothetical protein AAF517_13105, partial [Planctomycetota bacterium]
MRMEQQQRARLDVGICMVLLATLPVVAQPSFTYSVTGEDPAPGIPNRFVDATAAVDLSASELSKGSGVEALSLGIDVSGGAVVGVELSDAIDTDVLSFLNVSHDESSVVLAAVADESHVGSGFLSEFPATILSISLRARVPASGECDELYLRFVDGVAVDGRPTRNLVTHDGESFRPTFQDATLDVCGLDRGPDPSFAFSLSGPSRIEGVPGTTTDFRVRGLLATTGLADDAAGGEALSMAISLVGCEPTALVPDRIALPENSLEFLSSGVSEDGVVLAAVFIAESPRRLPVSEDPVRLFELAVRGVIDDDCSSCRVRFLDGVDAGGRPARNLVTYEGRSIRPSLGEITTELCRPSGAVDPNFRYEFSVPSDVIAPAGQEVTFRVQSHLVTEGVDPQLEGAEAWSLAIESSGAEVLGVYTGGTVSDDAEFLVWEHDESGVVLAAVVSTSGPGSLSSARSPARLVSFDVVGVIPKDGSCQSVSFAHRDGVSVGNRPVRNVVTFRGSSYLPERPEAAVRLCSNLCELDPRPVVAGGTRVEALVEPVSPQACFRFLVTPELPVAFDLHDLDPSEPRRNARRSRWNWTGRDRGDRKRREAPVSPRSESMPAG